MKVSVVTPNYNGERFLKTFLESLNEDSEYIGEVILRNNTFDAPYEIYAHHIGKLTDESNTYETR